MNRFGLIIGTALAVAACQGTAPQGNTAEQSEAKDLPRETVDTTIADWSSGDVEVRAFRVGYGAKPSSILQRTADGALIFTPQTPKDHVALPFIPLASSNPGRSMELKVTVDAAGSNCVANLQDQSYVDLTSVPCSDVGEHEAVVTVPSGVMSVRVYFISAGLQPVRLPARIQVIGRP